MPLRKEQKAKYLPPREWKALRAAILERAGNRCERCGVPNYALGYRDPDGSFQPAEGDEELAAMGAGLSGYARSREMARMANDIELWRGVRAIVIVLTCAHLNHDPTDNRFTNIRAYCQACHLRYDQSMHQRVRRYHAEARKRRLQPLLFDPQKTREEGAHGEPNLP